MAGKTNVQLLREFFGDRAKPPMKADGSGPETFMDELKKLAGKEREELATEIAKQQNLVKSQAPNGTTEWLPPGSTPTVAAAAA